MRREGAFVIAMLVTSLAAMAPADADGALDTAKAAVDASDFMAARTQLTQLVDKGGNSPEDMAEIYRLSGIIAGALGEKNEAVAAFQRCLALTPKAALAPGTSPKITRPFVEAQGYFKTHEPLKIKVDTRAPSPVVTFTVVSDPLEMIVRVRVIASVDKRPPKNFEKPAADEVMIALPAGARIDLRVIALDGKGNSLAEVGSVDVPIVIVGIAPPVVVGGTSAGKRTANAASSSPRSPRSPRPVYLKWWLWGGTSLAFAAGASYFAFGALSAKQELDALNAASINHDFDEAKAVEDRGKRDALITNIGFGAAGALAVVGVILYLTEPRSTEVNRVTTTITPVPIRGGGTVVLAVPF